MDAYVSGEAYHALQAVSLLRTPSASDGLLIGHIRGHRFFVEKAFVTGRGFFSSPEEYIRLSHHFEERILGFFTFSRDDRRVQKVLSPLSCGKLLLRIETTDPPKMKIRAWIIDFDKDFYLSPIRLKSSK